MVRGATENKRQKAKKQIVKSKNCLVNVQDNLGALQSINLTGRKNTENNRQKKTRK